MRNSAIGELAVLATASRPNLEKQLRVRTKVAEFLGSEWVTFRSTDSAKRTTSLRLEAAKAVSSSKSETYFSAAGGQDYGLQFALLKCAGWSRRRTWIEG